MPTAIVLPDIAGGEALSISGWLVDVGGEVYAGSRVVEVLAEGITFDVPAPMSGRLVRIAKPIEATVRPGDILGWIEVTLPEQEQDADEPAV